MTEEQLSLDLVASRHGVSVRHDVTPHVGAAATNGSAPEASAELQLAPKDTQSELSGIVVPCAECGQGVFGRRKYPGPRYCKTSHRVKAYRRRKRQREAYLMSARQRSLTRGKIVGGYY